MDAPSTDSAEESRPGIVTGFRPFRLSGTSVSPAVSLSAISISSDDEIFSTNPAEDPASPDAEPYSPSSPRHATPIIPLSPVTSFPTSTAGEFTAAGYSLRPPQSLAAINWQEEEPASAPTHPQCCIQLLPSAADLVKMLDLGKRRVSLQQAMGQYPQFAGHDLYCPAVRNLYHFHEGTHFPNNCSSSSFFSSLNIQSTNKICFSRSKLFSVTAGNYFSSPSAARMGRQCEGADTHQDGGGDYGWTHPPPASRR